MQYSLKEQLILVVKKKFVFDISYTYVLYNSMLERWMWKLVARSVFVSLSLLKFTIKTHLSTSWFKIFLTTNIQAGSDSYADFSSFIAMYNINKEGSGFNSGRWFCKTKINNLFNVVLNSLVALEFLILNNKYIILKKEQEIFGSLEGRTQEYEW